MSNSTILRRACGLLLLMSSMGTSALAFDPDPIVLDVKGKVTSEKGEVLPGVTVVLQGTNIGTFTDAEGSYSLAVPEEHANGTLVFSFVGFLTKEVPLENRTVVDVSLAEDNQVLSEVVVVGYGSRSKESITSAVSSVESKDLERVAAVTVSTALAGKLPGVSFRQAEGRPGASANIQIRNMGNPLFVIDGIQKDAGQFNNLSPQDIESISVLKDAAASIYGSRAANGVVIVTTKRGKRGQKPTVNINAYYGLQNWTRFPETVNAYEWMTGKADAEMNAINPSTAITPAELEKWRQGTEPGYRNFDWYPFIIQDNAPLTQISMNTQGGSDKINYYLSGTRLDQSSVLGREFTFDRTNIQSNVDASITDKLKVGVQINGRIETRENPGVPGTDDYWLPRLALFRNRPTERPYANDNPKYIAQISEIPANWAYLNKETSGYLRDTWRVLQTNFSADYELPLKGLTARGMYSFYYADNVLDVHEYTYDVYTYFPATEDQPEEYRRTAGSDNPWRERRQQKILEEVTQGQLNYNNQFGKHTVGASMIYERISRRHLNNWMTSIPTNNVLPLIQFADINRFSDADDLSARIGYVGQFNYNYDDKYYLDLAGRRDASWKFAPGQRWGFFPSVSAGWRITSEEFFRSLIGTNFLSDLKFRASYGKLGDDDVGIGPFDYLSGYQYGTSNMIIDGNLVVGTRDRGVPVTNISWFTSTILDVGLDYSFLNGKISGTLDYFHRKRTGLRGRRWDILTPVEIGYNLPEENVNSDAVVGGEGSIAYAHSINNLQFSIGANLSYARKRNLETYKPRWGNSWEHYRTSIEDRWSNIFWGYIVEGQFQSQEQVNNHPVNIDGQGNRTLLPGDFIYQDVNKDGVINNMDERPIGYGIGQNPTVNMGMNITMAWKGFDLAADFSGGSMYAFNRNWEMRWPFQVNGNLLRDMYDDRWHRADPFDLDSEWIPGKNPPLRWNDGGHSNYNKSSNRWLINMYYFRLRTLEVGYSMPQDWLTKVRMQRLRLFVNTYNMFSVDPLREIGLEPEVADENGLQYPQHFIVNFGINVSL